MPDGGLEIEGLAALGPEDNLFGRVILRNRLVEAETLQEVAQELLEERRDLGSKRKLSDLLLDRGLIQEETVAKINAAILKKMAEHKGAQAPPGASGVIDAAAKPSKHGEARRRVRAMSDAQQEETLRRFIKLAIKGRLHQAVLNHLVTRMMISINPKSVATSLAANPDDVVKVLRDWKKVGIVKTMGAHPYAYQPSEDDRESINLFCRLWRDRRWHPKLLAMIMEGK